MTWKCDTVHGGPLRPAASDEEYLLHQAALEWSLADSIVIKSIEESQGRANWRDRLEPYLHQEQNLITFCRRLPVMLLADDVGLGKTISAGLIVSELMARKRVSRVLILCPKILCPQWEEELFEKFGIEGKVAFGEQLDEAMKSGTVVITTYESAAKRLGDLNAATFDMLILDEAHRLRNLYGQGKPPKIATNIRDALQKRLFKFVVMLTATPIQNRLWDIYSLIDCLTIAKGANQNPLGSPREFENKYLVRDSDGRRLRKEHAESFRSLLRQYIARVRRDDAGLQFPVRTIRHGDIELSPEEKQLTRLAQRHIGDLSPLLQISLAQAMMSSPRAFAAQLENMAARLPDLGDAARQAKAIAISCTEPAKLKRLLDLCDELKKERPSNWRVVVFTGRKETQDTIREGLGRRKIPVGIIRGGDDRSNKLAIEQFKANPPDVHVLVSTDAGSQGINLQCANVLVNYDLPWNPMVVEQRIGRIQRLKSEAIYVVIWNLIARNSVEERIVARLMEKLQSISQAIGDIESILESSDWDGDDDRFENQIRELVVKALLGTNTDEATRLAYESIERAKRLIDEQQKELNDKLGRLDDYHRKGTRAPKLERRSPSINATEFVLRAKRAGGGTISETSPGVYEVRQSDRPHEVIVFDEDVAKALSHKVVFMGNVRVYEPGKPEFERLVQHWVDRCGLRVCDLRRPYASTVERLAQTWCEAMPGVKFLDCKVLGREAKFQGNARIKIKASNGVDGYEKLIAANFHPESHMPVAPTTNPSHYVLAEAKPSEISPAFMFAATQAVEADRDVAEFCRFYGARQNEELAKAGDDHRLRHRIADDFAPAVVADIVGLQGVRYEEIRLQVRFTIHGEEPFAIDLKVVPVSGQIVEEPSKAICGHTGVHVPTECLEECSVTRMRVLRHLLIRSELSGRRGLQALRCEVTGKKVLIDEVRRCVISGRFAIQSELRTCQVTGVWLLPEHTGRSALSGKLVRKDLLSPSEKSPDRFGMDGEFKTCAITGKRLLLNEGDYSVVSRKWADRELLFPSDLSGGLALAHELIRCQESGARLLPAEVGRCEITRSVVGTRLLSRSEVSRRVALTRLLARCAHSGTLAIIDGELEECDVSGDLVLPKYLGTCAISGKRVLISSMVACQHSGEWILGFLAGKSDYSRKVVNPRYLITSHKPPGRKGLPNELGTCAVSSKRILLDEGANSVVSRKWADRELLIPSDVSGGLALPGELIRCQESEARLLPSEAGRCEITELVVDSRLLSVSESSRRVALKRLMGRCALTETLAIIDGELEECDVSGDLVLPKYLGTCAISGKRVLISRMVACQHSGEWILGFLAGKSDYSRKVVNPRYLITSHKPPGRKGLPDEFGTCAVSSKRILLDEGANSVVSRKWADRELLIPSDVSGGLALAGEMVRCQESGINLLPSESGRCEITKLIVDSRLLSRSEVSRVVALTQLMGRCAVTGKLAITGKEIERCSVSGNYALPNHMRTCAVTGKRGIRERMSRSSVSGKYVIPTKAVKSAVSGRIGLPEECVQCTWLEQPILREEAKGCSLTRLVVAESLLNEDAELIVLRDILDDDTKGTVADNLIPDLISLDPPFFRGLKHVWTVKSPKGGKLAVCGEIHGWLKTRYVGFLVKTREALQIIGAGVLGYRGNHGWKMTDEVEFS